MDDPADELIDDEDDDGLEPDPIDRFLALVGPRMDELRSLVEDFGARWRGDAVRIGEGGRQRLTRLFYELGLITREDWDELDLRVAQLEHRVRLIEERLPPAP